MENQFDQQLIRAHLDRICNDPEFAKSQRYVELLTLLVEQAMAGRDLKEHAIGAELFEQHYNPIKDDGKVRVYMYNLRKKLDTYYAGPGQKDVIIFLVEKGSYNLKFIPNDAHREETHNSPFNSYLKKNRRYFIRYVIPFFLASTFAIYYSYFTKECYFWDAFLDKNANNICILADQVVLHQKGDAKGKLTLVKEINSYTDFINYKGQHEEDSLEIEDYTFYTKAIPYSVQTLTRFFTQHNRDFSLVRESELRFEDTKRNNLLYIGQYKTMSISKEFFLQNSKVFKAYYSYFAALKDGKEKKYNPTYKNGVRAEYAIVSYIPLENGHKALYFVSNHDIGTMATINKFIDKDFLKEFYKKLPSAESYFNALFKVEGIDRTDASCELVELEVIEE